MFHLFGIVSNLFVIAQHLQVEWEVKMRRVTKITLNNINSFWIVKIMIKKTTSFLPLSPLPSLLHSRLTNFSFHLSLPSSFTWQCKLTLSWVVYFHLSLSLSLSPLTHPLYLHHSLFVLLKNTNKVWIKTNWQFASSFIAPPLSSTHDSSLTCMPPPFIPPSLSCSSCQEASLLKIHAGAWAAFPKAFVRQTECLKSRCH